MQSEDPKAEATACASQRSCVKSYPIQQAYGLLWVWPDASANAALEAAAASPVVSQHVHDIYATGRWHTIACLGRIVGVNVLLFAVAVTAPTVAIKVQTVC